MNADTDDDSSTTRHQHQHSSQGDSDTDSLQRSVRKNGRFIIPWPAPKAPSLGRVLKWMILSKDNSRIPSKQELDETLPVLKPDLSLLSRPPSDGLRVTWIGHATVLLQMEQLSVLTDPMFSSRCSPVQFAGPKRYRPVPCTVHDLPRIDAVVISHNHYDHLDLNSVTALNARFGADLRWFVPLGLADWMHNTAGCDNVIELDWWQENCIPEHPHVKFVFTPAQHFCKRTPTDDNKVLWGSWCMIGPRHRFYFAGDTGYCHMFEIIGRKYGPFDLAAIPIGAYEPRWFMASQHVDPAQAVRMHQDLRAHQSMAIHWGTFSLANEYYLEPPEQLSTALTDAGLTGDDDFLLFKHGETRALTGLPSPARPHTPQPQRPPPAS